MRVLHILETLSPRYGGPARVVMELVRAQQRAGHEVEVISTESDHPHGVYHEPGWDTLADGAVRVYYGAVQFAPLRVSVDIGRYLKRVITGFEIVRTAWVATTVAPCISPRQLIRRASPYLARATIWGSGFRRARAIGCFTIPSNARVVGWMFARTGRGRV